MTLKYILWDHDGVLVDTEQWYFEATRSAMAKLNVPLPIKLIDSHAIQPSS